MLRRWQGKRSKGTSLVNAVSEFVTRNMLPFTHVECPALRKLFEIASRKDHTIFRVTASEIRRHIQRLASVYRKELSTEFKGALLSITSLDYEQ